VRRVIRYTLIAIAYLLVVFAIMRPQGNPDQSVDLPEENSEEDVQTSALALEDIRSDGDGETVTVRDSARDVIFLLDVSASMGAEDLYPNRLEKAKDMIRDALEGMESEHVGLVIFTSVPSVKCVLTLDYTFFRQALADVEINDNDFAGTRFMPALTEIVDRQFDFSENKYKDLIVITDGGDTELEGLEGGDQTALAQTFYDLARSAFDEKQIRIHTVGLGTRAGSIVHGVKDENGNPVKSSLNEGFLQGISKHAQGVYVSAADSNVDMKQIYMTRISSEKERGLEQEREVEVDEDKLKELVQKQRQQEDERVVYQEFYPYPLYAAVLCLIVELLIPLRRRPSARRGRAAA
jgi:Ca-activated chloride channel family protein